MSLTPSNWHYNITQVSEITGLSKQVIRKWEERYQLVQPERLENGHRVYSDKDLQLLLKVRGLSEQGYSIKQAAIIAHEQNTSKGSIIPSITPMNEEMNDFCLLLLEKGVHCDETELNRLLQQANHSLGLSKFLSHVVIPFLKEVGNRWEKKEWTEYQEAVSTMVVRDYLVQLRRNYHYKEDAPLIMGACLPGEYHEVPLHILLLQAMMVGWRSFLVGSSPAIGAIESLVTQFQPKVVLLSAMTTTPFELHPTVLQQLDVFASKYPSIRFFIGGAGSVEYLKNHPLHSIAVASTIEEIMSSI
ncbi:transcriptional regulator, marr family protein [Lysinibacillus contaminans]|uniref:Transcriptional regulator, marr family protein n=1 Tax=Lysinibacillus contaminans TaxID=1293441 RepID=A0ABR5JVQ4_9BACI|nr:MerR family transcriptional regulator [Lysinibacillus contaminans]KOS66229.1 transcriptional regulator, marr family protein [Lysinibacillus contaminans]